jgi:hypothetical protein
MGRQSRRIIAAAFFVLLWVSVAGLPASAQTPIIDATGGITDIATSGTTGLPCSPCPVTSGFDFTVTGSSLTITSLGLFDVGNSNRALTDSHPVGLWNASGTLLASTTIDNTATPVTSTSSLGHWLKKDIVQPITLSPGTYVLGAFYLPNSADLTSYGGVTSPISGVTLGNARFANFASTLVFPTIISPFPQQNHYIFGPMAFTSLGCQVKVTSWKQDTPWGVSAYDHSYRTKAYYPTENSTPILSPGTTGTTATVEVIANSLIYHFSLSPQQNNLVGLKTALLNTVPGLNAVIDHGPSGYFLSVYNITGVR